METEGCPLVYTLRLDLRTRDFPGPTSCVFPSERNYLTVYPSECSALSSECSAPSSRASAARRWPGGASAVAALVSRTEGLKRMRRIERMRKPLPLRLPCWSPPHRVSRRAHSRQPSVRTCLLVGQRLVGCCRCLGIRPIRLIRSNPSVLEPSPRPPTPVSLLRGKDRCAAGSRGARGARGARGGTTRGERLARREPDLGARLRSVPADQFLGRGGRSVHPTKCGPGLAAAGNTRECKPQILPRCPSRAIPRFACPTPKAILCVSRYSACSA
jgi:hypothetical protein